MKKLSLLAATALVAASTSANAAEATSLEDALMNGDASLSLRYRFENLDSDKSTHTKESDASTLRTRLGYTTGTYKDLAATIEFENVTVIGDDHYNDGKNGRTERPEIADAAGTELNQFYIDYTGIQDTLVRVGRQNVEFDNGRHIGTIDWRQNNQNYDAAVVINSSLPDTTLIYGFVDNVNRADQTNLGTQTHLVNASYAGLPFGTLTGYAYIIDLERSLTLDSKTFGARFTGSTEIQEGTDFIYEAEYARQSDHAENTTNYSADYYKLGAGVAAGGLTVKAGFESLGSDNNGTVGFATALASYHGQNGWADVFSGSTPVAGLEDAYGSISYKVKGLNENVDGTKIEVIYHDFSSEHGSTDYGTEWDAKISKKFGDRYNAALIYADYDADNNAPTGIDYDKQKLAVMVGAEF